MEQPFDRSYIVTQWFYIEIAGADDNPCPHHGTVSCPFPPKWNTNNTNNIAFPTSTTPAQDTILSQSSRKTDYPILEKQVKGKWYSRLSARLFKNVG
jgi:hypothetical protein